MWNPWIVKEMLDSPYQDSVRDVLIHALVLSRAVIISTDPASYSYEGLCPPYSLCRWVRGPQICTVDASLRKKQAEKYMKI